MDRGDDRQDQSAYRGEWQGDRDERLASEGAARPTLPHVDQEASLARGRFGMAGWQGEARRELDEERAVWGSQAHHGPIARLAAWVRARLGMAARGTT